MAYEMTVGLLVVDQQKYTAYRAAIAPLLEEYRAGFPYDFDIARTLKTSASHEINRVFVIRFPDRAAKERFFADPRYVAIRAERFVPSVAGTTMLGEREDST
jgi:uncharacterized protein (DUF1330 family)